MCDLSPVRNWLIATLIAIFAAISIIIGAAIANGSWWLAWTAPIGMAVAKGRPAAYAYAYQFIEETNASGSVRDAIGRYGLVGVRAAPPTR